MKTRLYSCAIVSLAVALVGCSKESAHDQADREFVSQEIKTLEDRLKDRDEKILREIEKLAKEVGGLAEMLGRLAGNIDVPAKPEAQLSEPRITLQETSEACVNRLKNIGLAFRIWATDNADKFPFNLSTAAGGTMEFCRRGADGYETNPARHFLVMSNELSIPRLLVCPADSSKQEAVNWSSLRPENVSYQLRSGPEIDETRPQEILVRCPFHGHVVLCDGSVRQAMPSKRVGERFAVPADPRSQANACVQNLRQIDSAKEQWALENKKIEGASTAGSETAINAFMRSAPVCPVGGTYTYGRIGENPRCTLAGSGHRL